MHNGRLADALDPWAKKLKALSKKRDKTDEEHMAVADIEFMGGLYWSDDLGVYMPADNLQRMFRDAGAFFKLGKKSVGILVDADYGVPMIFDGHKNLEKLKSDDRFRFRKVVPAGSPKSRVARTRPMIPTGWTMEFAVLIDPAIFDVDRFDEVCMVAGARVGLGDWRPGSPMIPGTFGKFEVLEISG